MHTTDIHLLVHAENCAAGSVDFRLEEVPPASGYFNNGTLDFKGVTDKNFRMKYDLKDHTGLGLRLKKDKNDAFWISEGAVCPTTTCSADNDEFKVRVRSRRTILDLIDRNRDEKSYAYSINYADRNGAPHRCDPIVENGGGGINDADPGFPFGQEQFGLAAFAIATGAAVLGAAAWLLGGFGAKTGFPRK